MCNETPPVTTAGMRSSSMNRDWYNTSVGTVTHVGNVRNGYTIRSYLSCINEDNKLCIELRFHGPYERFGHTFTLEDVKAIINNLQDTADLGEKELKKYHEEQRKTIAKVQ